MNGVAAVTQLVEFWPYTLVPGRVEAFVEHFERHFLAPQEKLGVDIVGQFTVPGDEARFVWVRRFWDPAARAEALASFYGGPAWKEFGPRANELMIDHTDVHLLVPDRSAPAFVPNHAPHARLAHAPTAAASAQVPSSWPPSTTWWGSLSRPWRRPRRSPPHGRRCPEMGCPSLVASSRPVFPTGFPRLPVHEDVTAAVWLLSDPVAGEGRHHGGRGSGRLPGPHASHHARLAPTAPRRCAEPQVVRTHHTNPGSSPAPSQ